MSNVDEVIALLKKKVTWLEDDKQAAEQRAERYEKALKEIRKEVPNQSWFAKVIDKALTTKTSTDE